MPPKKKKGGKSKKGASKKGASNNVDGLDIALSEDKVKRLESQTQALEMQLAYRSELTFHASQESKHMREQLKQTNQKVELAQEETQILTQDMTRQYMGMQDDLLNQIKERDRLILNLQDEIQELKKTHAHELQQRDAKILEKKLEIEQWKIKMEELSADFGRMLSDALAKMNERLEVHSVRQDEHAVPIQHRMEEFNFKATA